MPERRVNERLLDAVIDAAGDALTAQDSDGVLCTWNAAAERLFGWPAADVIGRPALDLVPVGYRDEAEALLAVARDTGRAAAPSVPRLHRDGHELRVAVTVSAVRDAGGAFVGATTTARSTFPTPDAVDGPSRRADTLFRQLAGGLAFGCTMRRVGSASFFFVNESYREIIGLPPGRPLPGPRDVLSFVHHEDRQLVAQAQLSAENGSAQVVEMRLVRPDGDIRWVHTRCTPIADPDGGRPWVVTTIEDITEQRLALAALSESEQRFQQLAHNIPIGFHLAEVDPAKFLYVSPGWVELFGMDPLSDDPAALRAGAVSTRIHDEDRDRVLAAHRQPIADWDGRPLEYRLIRGDGSLRWIRTNRIPITDGSGTPVRVAAVSEDVTEAKLAEAALQVARQEAEQANAAKSEFLSRMSHELRTPLNAVLGFAQLLELDPLTDSQQNAVRHILRGGRHLLEMIDDVLDIARIETDQLQISTEPVLMAEVLSDTVGLMRPLAGLRRIAIEIDESARLSSRYVLADRRRMRQVLLNLLSNAVKYNRNGGAVTVSGGAEDDAWVRVSVTDTGLGIRPDDLPRLFTPFDRFGPQSTEVEGTGIGLALSHRLVELMGGLLQVASEPGTGSTFTVLMPAAEPTTAAVRPGPPRVAADSLRGGRLLYIEDNNSNVQLLDRILDRRSGWTMQHASHGAQGLQLATGSEPTLIMLDLHLPDMDGIDVLHALRADPLTAEVPVVVVSADASPRQIRRLLSAGARRYLTKPLDVAEILQVLDVYADRPTG